MDVEQEATIAARQHVLNRLIEKVDKRRTQIRSPETEARLCISSLVSTSERWRSNQIMDASRQVCVTRFVASGREEGFSDREVCSSSGWAF